LDDFVHRTDRLLQQIAPSLRVSLGEKSWGTTFTLERPERADYTFALHIVDGGEPQLCALPTGFDERTQFWYWPFERADYTSPEEQFRHFEECIRMVLHYPTRITQRKGWLLISFICEAQTAKSWRQIGGNYGCFRLFFRGPQIADHQHVYLSPALVQEGAD
jgi:hypothetical protein